MIRYSPTSSENSSSERRTIAEAVRLRDTSPRQAAEAGVTRVSEKIHRAFESVKLPQAK